MKNNYTKKIKNEKNSQKSIEYILDTEYNILIRDVKGRYTC